MNGQMFSIYKMFSTVGIGSNGRKIQEVWHGYGRAQFKGGGRSYISHFLAFNFLMWFVSNCKYANVFKIITYFKLIVFDPNSAGTFLYHIFQKL